MMSLGTKLRTMREELSKTQKDVAEALHIARTSYANYERDVNMPEYTVLVRLADYYGVNTDYLLGRTETSTDWAKLAEELGRKDGGAVNLDRFLALPPEYRRAINTLIDGLDMKRDGQ
ncbi:MAG: helix-turn-helix domain-containing protein, partial [Clostridiales bacterium]|nr:helix-turn-helix domain-containing protein [Clostridiales bacterium]